MVRNIYYSRMHLYMFRATSTSFSNWRLTISCWLSNLWEI